MNETFHSFWSYFFPFEWALYLWPFQKLGVHRVISYFLMDFNSSKVYICDIADETEIIRHFPIVFLLQHPFKPSFVNNPFTAEYGSDFENVTLITSIGNRLCAAVNILLHPRSTEFWISLFDLPYVPLRSTEKTSDERLDMTHFVISLNHPRCGLCKGSNINRNKTSVGIIPWLLENCSNKVDQGSIGNFLKTVFNISASAPLISFEFSSLIWATSNRAFQVLLIVQ